MKRPKRSVPSRTSSSTSIAATREAPAPPATDKHRKIIVGCDHAAVAAKRIVIDELERAGALVEDVGTDATSSVDYPDYAIAVARAVSSGRSCCGVLLCSTGIGMSMAANKVAGVRAALVHDVTGARMSRLHNDANVLVLGGGVLGERLIREIVEVWMSTRFEGGRHQRRVDKINALDADK